ncbi:MAG: hypothetical protein ABSD30_06140 [Candidatus Binatus sp.]
MAVGSSRVSLRARLTVAALSAGAIASAAVLVLMLGARLSGRALAPNAAQIDARARSDAMARIAALPLYFEKNLGQVDSRVRYLSRSGRYSLFLTDDAAVFSLVGGRLDKSARSFGHRDDSGLSESAVRVRLAGANPHPAVEGLARLPGRVNYLVGDRKNWRLDIPTFGRVRFHDVYPSIDVVYYGTPSALEYDLIAAPGADTSKIKFVIEGPASTSQTAAGDIVIETASGTIRIAKPQNYQQNADGTRTTVAGSFKLAANSIVVAGVRTREVAFALAGYDRNKTLFIDPGVETIPYSTYYGGSGSSKGPLSAQFTELLGVDDLIDTETGVEVAVDSSGKAYLAGTAYSSDLPTENAFISTLQGANSPPKENPNVYVAKFDPTQSGASSLVYATYLGANGNTNSGAKGDGDGDLGFGIAVDGVGDAYVVGQTYSGNSNDSPVEQFPGTANCGSWGQKNIGANAQTGQGFVSELNNAANGVVYSCYIPGGKSTTAASVGLEPGCMQDCDAYITGSTTASASKDGFVVTANAAQPKLASAEGSGISNAFMMVVGADGAGSLPVYSTYYGGKGNGKNGDTGLAISVRSDTEAAITGATFSSDLPLSASPAQSKFKGGGNQTSNAFVATFNPVSGAMTYGSYLGGGGTTSQLVVSNGDVGDAIVDDGGLLWVAGSTASSNFPVEPNGGIETAAPAYQASNWPEAEAGAPATTGFITEINPNGGQGLAQIMYSTYFGGTGHEFFAQGSAYFATGDGIGAMAEQDGIVYVTGFTTSAYNGAPDIPSQSFPFPVTTNNCQSSNNAKGINVSSYTDPVTAFVAALDTTQLSANSQLMFSTLIGGTGPADVGMGIAFNSALGEIYVAGTTYSKDFPVTPNAFQLFDNASSLGSTNAFLTVVNPAGTQCPTAFTKPTATPTATGGTPTPTSSATPTSTPTGVIATATPTATATPGATLKISPDSVDFGDKTAQGEISKPKTVTITNESGKNSKIKVMITGETTASPFAVKKACDKTLAPKKSCKVEVTFSAPMNTTPEIGALTINDDGAGAPQVVPLSGTAK